MFSTPHAADSEPSSEQRSALRKVTIMRSDQWLLPPERLQAMRRSARTRLRPCRRWATAALLGAGGLVTAAGAPAAAAQLPLACPQASGVASVAERSSVLVLDLGTELSCALSAALGPWGSRVVQSRLLNPGSSMPSSSLAARELARQHEVRAVVWLASDARGFALWVYDVQTDRSWTRP